FSRDWSSDVCSSDLLDERRRVTSRRRRAAKSRAVGRVEDQPEAPQQQGGLKEEKEKEMAMELELEVEDKTFSQQDRSATERQRRSEERRVGKEWRLR